VTVSQILPRAAMLTSIPNRRQRPARRLPFFARQPPGGQAGWIDYHPCNFSEIPVMIRRGLLPADVVFSLASPMDPEGNFALGLAPTTPWRRSRGRGRWCSR